MKGWARALHAACVGGWLGAALITGFVVAPHAFASMATRAQAGDFVGGILRVIDGAALAAGAIAIGVAVLRGGRFFRTRVGLGAALVAVGSVSFALAAKLAGMRLAMGPIDQLGVDDPRRKTFGVLHGVSMLILLAGMLTAAASLALEAQDESSRKSTSG